MEQIIYKVCSKCGRELPLESFEKRKDLPSGHGGQCKECRARRPYMKTYMKTYWKEYYKCNGKVVKTCQRCGKEFNTLNPNQKYCSKGCAKPMSERITYLRSLSLLEKKQRLKEQQKEWNKTHHERIKELRNKRKDTIREAERLYKRKRIHNDIDYRLKSLITNKVRQTINGNKKYNHSIELLGCSIEDVRKHLESQFTKGMTWDNWGVKGWHIDHIIPISSFDFTKKEDQYRCFHYTNLRPLWWDENIKKSNKIIEVQLKVI